ncbi:Zinc finger and SCAN domain-containing protein 2 [Eumeta japonica]|uniref:Zinc finger and SCAN domain-containing protein 2 n=1 Tax=Eumeta variegata TaxID=151549 RepID=A0A4C1XUQ2_EUMVA|nr:Zinc finger and SCAN domain-containing protein 2 [Eumeta japonica]
MEVREWSIRECSVRLRRCDFAGRGGAPQPEAVLAAPRAVSPSAPQPEAVLAAPRVVTPSAPQSSNRVQTLASLTTVGPPIVVIQGRQIAVPVIVWPEIDENEFSMKIEDEVDELSVKEELDIKAEVLLPQPPLPLVQLFINCCIFGRTTWTHDPPPALRPARPRRRSALSSFYKHGVAFALTASRLVAGWRWARNINISANLWSCRASAYCVPLPAQATPQTKVEELSCERDLGVPSKANFISDVRNTDDVLHAVIREPSRNSSNSEGTSLGIERSQCNYFVDSQTEFNVRTDVSKVKVETHIGGKECKYEHCALNTTKKPYKCGLCEYSASQKGNLKVHMSIHTDEKRYKCEQCEYRESSLSALSKHTCSHIREKQYKCKQCSYSTSYVSNLKTHMRKHTGEKPYKCEQCEYSASRLSNLKRHIRIHTGEKPYHCEQCDYSASCANHLKMHMRTHTGEKPYKCGRCEYSASQQGSLKLHMYNHMHKKPFECEHCEYSTSRRACLKRHMRTHTGEKPYKCGLCEYSASEQRTLKVHMGIHTDEKLYKCVNCEYSETSLSTAPPLGVTVGNRTIWQSPWVNGVCAAVMAGTSDDTMQESGNPVSAAGQGEKAGPQASSSSDCSSSVVGNLATGECTITSNSHLCNKNPDLFCYICGEFEPTKTVEFLQIAVKPQKTVIDDETEALEEMEVEKEEVPMEEEEEEEILGDENPKDKDFMPDKKTKDPETFSREELNDLIRDLNLPKDGAELLASRLKHKIY